MFLGGLVLGVLFIMRQTKICTKCKEEKELETFGKSKKTKDKKQNHCKNCVNKQKALVISKRVLPVHNDLDTKFCSKCKIEKNFSVFSNCASNPDGKMYQCSDCRKQYHTPKLEGVKIFSDRNEKLCSTCKQIKPFSDFNKTNRNKTGVISVCKTCKVTERKLVKEREKILPLSKTCTKCNLEKGVSCFVKDSSKSDGISCVCNFCINKHRVERYKNDLLFKISDSVRKAIRGSFKRCSKRIFTKSDKSENILGTTFLQMHSIIENQFLCWMNWENYGNVCETLEVGCSWDFDHIIPISYAKTEEEVYLLNHWSNFQPLCSKINRDEKKAKVYPCTNLELRITFWEDSYTYY